VEARIPDCRSNVENGPRRRPVASGPAAPASRMRRAVLGAPPVARRSPAGDARRPRTAGRSNYVVISRDGRKLVTRHRASTNMYSLTFCVRVMLPERHQWKPAVQAAAVILRTSPVTRQSPASSARRPRRAFALCRHIAGWTQACNYGLRYVAIATHPVHRLQIRPIVHN